MPRVLVPSSLPPAALAPLAGHDLVVRDDGEPLSATALAALSPELDLDAIVCLLTDVVDAAALAAAPTLRVVATVSVGYDNVDVSAATRAGVVVCNTPGVLDETTADLAFALILAASRQLSDAERDLRAGAWTRWKLDGFLGRDVHGSTLGLVGYGNIARAVHRRATGFGMRVLHTSRRETGRPGFVATLDELLGTADVVSLHVPLTEATRHLIDRRRLALMKPTAVLVNTSRGPVVDEVALAAALEDGHLFAAGLDVYEREPDIDPRLLAAPRTVLLPHVGSATVATRGAMSLLATTAVAEVLAGGRPSNVVNPEAFGAR